jgi:hypothetical protein
MKFLQVKNEGRERIAKAEVEDPAPGIKATLSPPTRLDDPLTLY